MYCYGSDIAAETAGIVLLNNNPKDIVSLIAFGKATYRKMIKILLWAPAYNLVALPLAAGVLYQSGILLSPAISAVLIDSNYRCNGYQYKPPESKIVLFCHLTNCRSSL